MGAVVKKTHFCTMGGISDLVNMGSTGRLRAWIFAMGVAVLGVAVLEYFGLVDLAQAFPPYRRSSITWSENILGGFMFGVGMTMASGCANKNLVLMGGGNLKSYVVFIVVAIMAYFMVLPFPGTDKTIYSLIFYPWMNPIALDLAKPQDLGGLIGGENPQTIRLILGLVVAVGLIAFALKSEDFRGNSNNVISGFVVGAAIVIAWYVSSAIILKNDLMGDLSLTSAVSQWDMISDNPDAKPAYTRNFNPQSFTFINPIGQILDYIANGLSIKYLSFGIVSVAGVYFGSMVWALVSKTFQIEWFASVKDFINHIIGAVLMGIGGVLGLGCTIGQGVTGISTLAVGSFLTFFGIFFGSYITMKIIYWRLMRE
jgi:hypothetical protein